MTRPAPMFMCPTSELPIWPAGRPTASPEVCSFVCAAVAISRSIVGVCAASMALPCVSSRQPKPSRMMSNARAGGVNARGPMPVRKRLPSLEPQHRQQESEDPARRDAEAVDLLLREKALAFEGRAEHRVDLAPDEPAQRRDDEREGP